MISDRTDKILPGSLEKRKEKTFRRHSNFARMPRGEKGQVLYIFFIYVFLVEHINFARKPVKKKNRSTIC